MDSKQTAALLLSGLLVFAAACGNDGGNVASLDSDQAASDPAGQGESESDSTASESSNNSAQDLATVQPLNNDGHHRAIGSFVAKEEVTISAKVGGTLLTLGVDKGDQVSPNTQIAQIDTEDYDLAVQNARALLAVAEASLDNARSEFERKQQLFEENAITESTFDLVKTQLELAEAQTESARVAVAIAEKAQRDTTVKAGVRGVVSARMVSAGEFVGPGEALIEVSVVRPITMMFSVPERLAAQICEGNMVRARLAAYPGRQFTGEVRLVSPTIDPATRTVPIEAEFDNEDGALKPGFFADCVVSLCDEQMLFLVAAEALFEADLGFELHLETPEGTRIVPVVLVERQGSQVKIAPASEGELFGGEQALLR